MTYTSWYGATECLECAGESYTTSAGSVYCQTDCTFPAIIGATEIEFSLSGKIYLSLLAAK